MNRVIFCSFLSLFTPALYLCLDEVPLVNLPAFGKVEGIIDRTVNNRTFYSFEGIPYAKPPVGKYRFKEPIPHEPWKGIWRANTKYECLQCKHFPAVPTDPVEGTEDCLYINVYTPKINAKLDVIVYIHGGAFIFGSGAKYSPHILLDENDVVYVSLNYRLGPLGFLSTENDLVPGNNGLKDQILALKWVKENIQHFGGNPESITITGMSAGGASVHFHTMTSKSKGLFSKALSMSGCMLNPWVLMENPLERTMELASHVGCNFGKLESVIDCLRERPGKQIVGTVKKFQPWLFNPFSPFGVVVDEWSNDPVLPKHPLQMLREGLITDVPWLSSHVTGEGLYPGSDFYRDENLEFLNENWDEIIPHILHYNFTVEQKLQKFVNSKIRNEYFGKQRLSHENFDKLIDLIGDRLFKVDIETCTKLHSKAIRSSVFHYLFDYRGAHSWSEDRSGTNIGISHADDTAYVLGTALNTRSNDEDRKISNILVNIFRSFAKTGEPKLEGFESWPNVPKNLNEPLVFLRIGSKLSFEECSSLGNRKFWETLPIRENEKLFSLKDEL